MIPDIRIRWNGVKVRLRGAGFRKRHNLLILDEGLDSIRARLARAIGQDDGPTKPLTKRYARLKQRQVGRNKRDLRFKGSLLEGIKPRYADDHRAIADASGRLGRIKAAKYRDLLLFSPIDQRAMSAKAGRLFRSDSRR